MANADRCTPNPESPRNQASGTHHHKASSDHYDRIFKNGLIYSLAILYMYLDDTYPHALLKLLLEHLCLLSS